MEDKDDKWTLPMGYIINGPIEAAAKANKELAKTMEEFLKENNFEVNNERLIPKD